MYKKKQKIQEFIIDFQSFLMLGFNHAILARLSFISYHIILICFLLLYFWLYFMRSQHYKTHLKRTKKEVLDCFSHYSQPK